MRLLQHAEQVAREVAAEKPEIALLDTDLLQAPSGPVFVVSIATPRDPSPGGVSSFEQLLRERLANPELRVVVRRIESTDSTAKGRILFGAAHFSHDSEEMRARRRAVEDEVRKQIDALPQTFAGAIDAVTGERGWVVRAEAVGARMPTPEQVRKIEQAVSAAIGQPISVSLLARLELVVTGSRYQQLGTPRDRDP
jgi:hypothetical protein